MKKSIIPIVLITLSVMSCNTQKKIASESGSNANEVAATQLTDIRWVLSELEGKEVDAPGSGQQQINFTLNGSDNTLNGFFGCNRGHGSFTIETGNRIRFTNIATTRMACPEGEISEFEVLKTLDLVDNYTVVGNKLMLTVGKRAPMAVFTKQDTENPITEKYWKLKVLEGKDVKMAEGQQKEIYFMLLNEDQRVTGFAGCNTFGGSYTLEEGGRIRFTNLLTTMMACPDLEINESDFLQVFELADNYSLNGDTLTLNVGRRAPLAVFEAVYFD